MQEDKDEKDKADNDELLTLKQCATRLCDKIGGKFDRAYQKVHYAARRSYTLQSQEIAGHSYVKTSVLEKWLGN